MAQASRIFFEPVTRVHRRTDVTSADRACIHEGGNRMKPFHKITWTVLAVSIALSQPALAQDRGDPTGGRDTPTEERSDPGRDHNNRGQDDRGEPRTPPQRNTASDRDQSGETVPPRRVGTYNTTAGGPISEEELELTCGDAGWIETWLEDANGNPIEGTYEYACLD
jgi:hypothetical protein